MTSKRVRVFKPLTVDWYLSDIWFCQCEYGTFLYSTWSEAMRAANGQPVRVKATAVC